MYSESDWLQDLFVEISNLVHLLFQLLKLHNLCISKLNLDKIQSFDWTQTRMELNLEVNGK